MIYQGSARYPVNEIVIHTTETRPDFMAGRRTRDRVAEVRRWHTIQRGWKDIGYHWLIDRDGTVAQGRLESVIGAGVIGHNPGVIHISLFGGYGHSASDPFRSVYTVKQEQALLNLIHRIGQRTKITKVKGHQDYAARACPCFKVADFLDSHGGLDKVLSGKAK